jgi:hypothetical protein
MEDRSNLGATLRIKSTIVPMWFDISTGDWEKVHKQVATFIAATMADKIVMPLLAIDRSPSYWMQVEPWPYPDPQYYMDLCELIDAVGIDWPIAAKALLLGSAIQYIKHIVFDAFTIMIRDQDRENNIRNRLQ